jgi:hypothetical protein
MTFPPLQIVGSTSARARPARGQATSSCSSSPCRSRRRREMAGGSGAGHRLHRRQELRGRRRVPESDPLRGKLGSPCGQRARSDSDAHVHVSLGMVRGLHRLRSGLRLEGLRHDDRHRPARSSGRQGHQARRQAVQRVGRGGLQRYPTGRHGHAAMDVRHRVHGHTGEPTRGRPQEP